MSASLKCKALAHDYKTNLTGFEAGVAGQNGHLTGGDETGPATHRAIASQRLATNLTG